MSTIEDILRAKDLNLKALLQVEDPDLEGAPDAAPPPGRCPPAPACRAALGLTIISDGTANGTVVKSGEKKIEGITKIEILPIKNNSLVSARLTFEVVALHIVSGLDRVDGKDCIDILPSEELLNAISKWQS